MLVCFYNSLSNGEYSIFFIVVASPIKNSYFLTFPNDKAEILSVC